MSRPSLSIAVITLNEADRIGKLLGNTSFADEIVVVDSGSTDGTQDLCRNAGARVLFQAWPGFSRQKQFALENASSDWILNLDADEAVSPELAAEIRAAIAQAPADVAGFSMPRLSWYLGRWIRHSGWYPDRKVRLVRRGRGEWSPDSLHEKLLVRGNVLPLSSPILHYTYRGVADHVEKLNRYSDLYSRDRKAAGGSQVLIGLFRAAWKFVECYFWKLGILDGLPGVVIAANSAWYIFLRHTKRWELSLREAAGQPAKEST